jgi:antitoxin component YwqK of YwqJK toxin-antitoxin module
MKKPAQVLIPAMAILLSLSATGQDLKVAKDGVFIERGVRYEITGKSAKLLPDSIRASHILLEPEDGTKAALVKAEELIEKIKAGNNSTFKMLAAEHSSDPGSKTKGGDLGWFPPGVMLAEFESAAFTHKKGDIFLCSTTFGIHIMKLTSVSSTRTPHEIPTYDNTKPFTGIEITKQFADGVKKQERVYKNGLFYQEVDYLIDGQKKQLVTYRDDQQSGPVTKWFDTGLTAEKGFLDGNGFQKQYKIWYRNGQLRSNCMYLDNKRFGTYTEWWENGIKKEEAYFTENKLDGVRKGWYKSGQLQVQASFVLSVPQGDSRRWYDNGNPQIQAIYDGGKRNGPLLEWYENGQMKFEGAFADDKLNGDYKTWYQDGRLKSEGTAENGNVIKESTY